MRNDWRHRIQFETLEGKCLLSTAAVDPAEMLHVATARNGLLNGTVRALFAGAPWIPLGRIDSIIFAQGSKLPGLGRVSGRISQGDPPQPLATYPTLARRPSLTLVSNGNLDLSTRRGTLQVALTVAPGQTDVDLYAISSGTGAFTGATGTGTLTIRFTPVLKLTFRPDRG